MSDTNFIAAPYGNLSKYTFRGLISGALATGAQHVVGEVPAGIEIYKLWLKFGTVVTPGTTTYDVGLRQVDEFGQAPGDFTDDLDVFLDGTARAASNAERASTDSAEPVLVDKENVELVITARTAGLVAASRIPYTITVEYITRGSP